jgi:hypothetical protein
MTVTNTVAVGSPNNASLVLDNFYALLTNATSATYADGTARNCGTYADEVVGNPSPAVVRGTGSAWTWSKQQTAGVTVAIIGAPPSTATAFCQNTRIVIAGETAATVPLARATVDGTQDNAATNGLWFGLVKNVVAGATFNGWAAASPWTGNVFAGFVRWAAPTTNFEFVTSVITRVIETQETCWFQMTTGAGGEFCFGAAAGGMIDPETGDAADAETDGRLYAVTTCGGGAFIQNCLLTTSGNGLLLWNVVSSNNPRAFSYTPGTASVVVCNRLFNSNATNLSLVTRTGRYPRLSYYASNPANWAGRLREVQVVREGFSQQTFNTGATINGFTFGFNPNLSGDCLLLEY